MNLVRSFVNSKRSSASGARELQISRPHNVGQPLSIDTSHGSTGLAPQSGYNNVQGNRNSMIQQSPVAGHHDFSTAQMQRNSQHASYFPQTQPYYPTPQPNNYAFPNPMGSPNMGPPQTSPAFQSPGFGQFPTSPSDYPTPGQTPISTPRYVLPSVVATQMGVDPTHSGMRHMSPHTMQPQSVSVPPPPPPPPPVQQHQHQHQQPLSLNEQVNFTLSDQEWQEALQAQQDFEWRMQFNQRLPAAQNRQSQPAEQVVLATTRHQTVDEDDDDIESSFYGMPSPRRNTFGDTPSTNIMGVMESRNDSSWSQALPPAPSFNREFRKSRQDAGPRIPTPPKKRSPEEEFYANFNMNNSANKLAQFTPESEPGTSSDQRRYEEPPASKSFSADVLSASSYPVPTPIASRQTPEDKSEYNIITGRFPNWFMDGTPHPEEGRGSGGSNSKRRRTLAESENSEEIYWGTLRDDSGQWSRMWYRLLDGIFDCYRRLKSVERDGLNPDTMRQLWEDMGFSIEENLYESQIRLAQSLFHPDPEDFVSNLLTKYFSLLHLPHVFEEAPVQPPPSFLPKCVNPEPPVPIPLLTREGFHRYMIHQTLLDPSLMWERLNRLLKCRPNGIVDPETSLLFVRQSNSGPIIPRQSFPDRQDDATEETEEKVRGWMRTWVKSEVDGWVGGAGEPQPPPPPQQFHMNHQEYQMNMI